jgi:endonuclease III
MAWQKKGGDGRRILSFNLGLPIGELSGSDIAFDVHVRRVFLRSGLAEHDDAAHMIAVARELNPGRPGALDLPAWVIGRQWCRPGVPLCADCPILSVCPRLVDRAADVSGV